MVCCGWTTFQYTQIFEHGILFSIYIYIYIQYWKLPWRLHASNWKKPSFPTYFWTTSHWSIRRGQGKILPKVEMVDLPVKVSHGMRKNQGIFERFRVPKKVKGNSFTFSEVLPLWVFFWFTAIWFMMFYKVTTNVHVLLYMIHMTIHMQYVCWSMFEKTIRPPWPHYRLHTVNGSWAGWSLIQANLIGEFLRQFSTNFQENPTKTPPVSIQTSKVCKCKSSEASFGFPQAILNTWCRYMPWTWITAKAVCFDEAKTLWCQGAGGLCCVGLGWLRKYHVDVDSSILIYYIFCCWNELSTSFYSTQLTTGVYLMLLFLASIAEHLPSGNWTQSWWTWASRKKWVEISE